MTPAKCELQSLTTLRWPNALRHPAFILLAFLLSGCAHDKKAIVEMGGTKVDLVKLQRELPKLQEEAPRMKDFTMYFFQLKESDRLPGLHRGQHGEANEYHLTNALQKVWLKERYIDNKMFSDFGNCENVYLMAVDPKGEQTHFMYVFCDSSAAFKFLCAYKWEVDHWSKFGGRESSRN